MSEKLIKLNYKTRGNHLKNKPRIFFSSHSLDFSKYFEEISEEVLNMTNAVIYYKNEAVSSREIIDDLSQINLFIVPITWNFLKDDCEARTIEFKYAKQHNIPILPILMEEDLDDSFNQECGNLHALSKIKTTKEQYRKKLKDYLESVLISDELRLQVQNAFDAYIFLSYRKIDRKYAEKIMHLIHENAFCRDIAIWYDEFLKPGYDFNQAIEDAIQNSKLFALVVTPNLVKEDNYVKNIEYPYARDNKKNIMPIEAKKTSQKKLTKNYTAIPTIVNMNNKKELSETLKKYLRQEAWTENKEPKHLYFMGLAYLNGIDVEINYNLARELLEKSAGLGLIEAMEKLVDLYRNGLGVKKDNKKAIEWQEKIINKLELHKRKNRHAINSNKNKLANLFSDLGDYPKALQITKNVYQTVKKSNFENTEERIYIMGYLAERYMDVGEYKKAIQFGLDAYHLSQKNLGQKDAITIAILSCIARAYSKLGNYAKAIEIQKKIYENTKRLVGEDQEATYADLNRLSQYYFYQGNYAKAIEIEEKVYARKKQLYEKEDRQVLDNLAVYYSTIGNYDKALENIQIAAKQALEELGEDHPNYLSILSHMANIVAHKGNNKEAITIMKNIYEKITKFLPKTHPTVLNYIHNLGLYYSNEKEYSKAVLIGEYVSSNAKKIFGKTHPHTLTSMANLSTYYYKLKRYEDAIRIEKQVYQISQKILGKTHPSTIAYLNNLSLYYNENQNNKKAIELGQKAFDLSKQKYGINNPDTEFYLENLVDYLLDDCNYQKAIDLLLKLYKVKEKKLGKENLDVQKLLQRIETLKKKRNEKETI